MSFKRNKEYGVVWRGTPNDTRNYIFDMETMQIKKVPTTKVCRCCGKELPISYFYLESSSKRKHKYQTRDVCVVCWDESNGKLFPEKTTKKQKQNDNISIDIFLRE